MMIEKTFHLVPFDLQNKPNIAIQVFMQLTDNQLRLTYQVTGDIEAIDLPAYEKFARGHELWKTTCFECFLKLGQTRYIELNFSPKGLWDIYYFSDYRKPADILNACHIFSIEVQKNTDKYVLNAMIDLDTTIIKQLNIASVIADKANLQTFWALSHSATQPDFHHPDAFIVFQ